MKVLRRKVFAEAIPSVSTLTAASNAGVLLTPSERLKIEEAKIQKQRMLEQRKKQEIVGKEKLMRIKQLGAMREAEISKDKVIYTNQVKLKEINESDEKNPASRNWKLVKSESKTSPVVSMSGSVKK